MTRADPQIKLRLPADLKDRLQAAAEAAGRSLNSEISSRLVVGEQFDGDLIRGAEALAKLESVNRKLIVEVDRALERADQAEAELDRTQAELDRVRRSTLAWMPTKVRAQLESAAKDMGRSLEAEMAARLERSLEPGSASLILTVARLERDLAEADLAKTTEKFRMWFVVVTLGELLLELPADRVLDGPLGEMTVEQWRSLAARLAGQTKPPRQAFDAKVEAYQAAEAKLASLLPQSNFDALFGNDPDFPTEPEIGGAAARVLLQRTLFPESLAEVESGSQSNQGGATTAHRSEEEVETNRPTMRFLLGRAEHAAGRKTRDKRTDQFIQDATKALENKLGTEDERQKLAAFVAHLTTLPPHE